MTISIVVFWAQGLPERNRARADLCPIPRLTGNQGLCTCQLGLNVAVEQALVRKSVLTVRFARMLGFGKKSASVSDPPRRKASASSTGVVREVFAPAGYRSVAARGFQCRQVLSPGYNCFRSSLARQQRRPDSMDAFRGASQTLLAGEVLACLIFVRFCQPRCYRRHKAQRHGTAHQHVNQRLHVLVSDRLLHDRQIGGEIGNRGRGRPVCCENPDA